MRRRVAECGEFLEERVSDLTGDRKGNGKTIAWQYTIEGRIEGRRGSHVCDWDKKPRR